MKLVAKVKGREYRDRNELCRNCFHVCSSAELLISHQKICLENDSVQITMPTGDKNVKFENYAARWFSPLGVPGSGMSGCASCNGKKQPNYFKHFCIRTTSPVQLLHDCC